MQKVRSTVALLLIGPGALPFGRDSDYNRNLTQVVPSTLNQKCLWKPQDCSLRSVWGPYTFSGMQLLSDGWAYVARCLASNGSAAEGRLVRVGCA